MNDPDRSKSPRKTTGTTGKQVRDSLECIAASRQVLEQTRKRFDHPFG